MKISHHDSKPKGEFTIEENGVEMGKLHYSWLGINTLIIIHTEVYPEFQHEGVGLALVEAAVVFAREKKIKIVPKCSFANAMFKEHDSWKEVLF